MRGSDSIFDGHWKFIRNGAFFLLCLTMILGFRVYPGTARWPVNPGSPKLWVNFCDRPTVTNNDLPAGDPLYGQTLNFNNVTQSVLDDYNNITTSYVKLYDEATDPTFTASDSTNKIINVCFSNLGPGESGEASQIVSNGAVTGCTVNIGSSITSSAKQFTSTLTHELGHCLGLDHPQETKHGIMSYFSSGNRLQIDDQAGISYLYPADSGYSNETPTMGFSCSPR